MVKQHPLRELHISIGARMGVFAGWETPISYTSVIDEHLAVRNSAGVFDLTHMGRIRIRGQGATELLDKLVPKKITKTQTNTMPGPTALLNGDAGFIDDIMPYRLGDDEWLLAVNASNTERDIEWIRAWRDRLGYKNVEIIDETLS
ncbi:MAG: glycine cleavage system protein T, partial [Desulfurococcales archaeon]|nr:glycine cleavage system protein T [Desulfurococcales archaeon]